MKVGRRQVRTLTGHIAWVMSIAFSRDGKLIVSGSDDALVLIWDTETGDEVSSHEECIWRSDVVDLVFKGAGRVVRRGRVLNLECAQRRVTRADEPRDPLGFTQSDTLVLGRFGTPD